VGRGVQVVVRRENAEMIQEISGAAVVPVCVLELPKVVQSRDLLESDLGERFW
jgi:hypothetical protein